MMYLYPLEIKNNNEQHKLQFHKIIKTTYFQVITTQKKKITRLHKSRSSRDELEFDLSNFV